jgi:replicative DNA helicase
MTAMETFARTPPWDRDAEMSVLGSMMLSEVACGDALGIVHERMFYEPRHLSVFAAIVEEFSAGGTPDPVRVGNRLTVHQSLAQVGGLGYLHSLIEAVTTPANVEHYARIVAGHWAARKAIEGMTRGVQHLYTGVPVDRVVDEVAGALTEAVVGDVDQAVVPFSSALVEALEDIEAVESDPGRLAGVSTGLADLDRLLGGFKRSQFVVIGARPAMGKSLLCVQMGLDAARAGHPVLLVSMEMSGASIGQRTLSAGSRVSLERMLKGGLTDQDWSRLRVAFDEQSALPMHLYCRGDVTLPQIRAEAHRLRLKYPDAPMPVIVVDYLQLMVTHGKVENRQTEVAAFSRGLKNLAADLGGVVIAASQLNRGPEGRAITVPRLSDLRESGAVEQDSDVVILLHREDYYDRDSPRVGEIDLLVAKNRNGQVGTVTAAFLGHLARIADLGDL